MVIKWALPVIFIPKSVSWLRSMFFCSFGVNPCLAITLSSHSFKYPRKSSSSHCQKCYDIMHTYTSCCVTFRRKSVADLYGSWNGFRLCLPLLKLLTLRLSKNRSTIDINQTVSLTSSPPVSFKALATDSLRTCKTHGQIHMYQLTFTVHNYTHLGCQVYSHFWKGGEVDVFKFQLWYKTKSSSFLSHLCVSFVQVFNVAPLKRLPIALNKKKGEVIFYTPDTCKHTRTHPKLSGFVRQTVSKCFQEVRGVWHKKDGALGFWGKDVVHFVNNLSTVAMKFP